MQPTESQTIHNLPKNAYLEYIKFFPITQSPQIRTYTTLILTLVAVICFSVFAISPTIKTIIELRKTLADSRFANDSLTTKIAAMQSLQEQYGNLGSKLNRISEAMPTSPETATLLAKIQTLAQKSDLHITKLDTLEVELTKQGTEAETPKPSSFVFIVTASGNYDQVTRFLKALHTFDRIVTIDSLAISRDTQSPQILVATIRARAYFHPEVLIKKGATSQ